MSRSHRVEFPGKRGTLAGILEIPATDTRGWILFSHCFTCSKDLKAIVRISRGLADCGWGVLRYDFSGLGGSDGDFADTNFTTNCEDLLSASDFLGAKHHAPRFLIGHSFGGAASLAMAQRLPNVTGVIAIAAPSDTFHLADLLIKMDPAIASDGIGTVNIGGQSLKIRKQMIEDFRKHDLQSSVRELQKPILVFHSPNDETVGFHHALRNTRYHQPTKADEYLNSIPRTLVALPGSNHLLTNSQRDIPLIVAIADAWCTRLI